MFPHSPAHLPSVTLSPMNVSQFQARRLGALLLLALVFRVWQPQRMAVEHFDEGVYASGHFSPALNFAYPDLHFYAPPAFPALLDWTLVFTGSWPAAVMWVNVLLGTLLVAAVWWTLRELCVQPGTGAHSAERPFLHLAPLGAAALVASHETFIQYSRAALTDIPLCLAMTLAVGAGARALRTGSWRWVGLAGLATAAAWWTKYNGWLPLAIFVSGTAGWAVLDRWMPPSAATSASKKSKSKPKPITRAAIRVVTICLLAALLWLPYLNSLQPHGGYAAVSANHAGYLVGWSGWGNSAQKHLAVDRFDSQSVTMLGLLLAVQFSGTIFTWNSSRWHRDHLSRVAEYVAYLVAIFAMPLAYFVGFIPTLAGGLISWLVFGILRWPQRRATGENLNFLLLLAWFTGLLLTTPLYTPYPRLILPWLVSACMAAAWGWSDFFVWLTEFWRSLPYGSAPDALGTAATPESPFEESRRIAGYRPWLLFGLLLIALPRASVWPERRNLQRAADGILTLIETDLKTSDNRGWVPGDAVIYVLAEPGLYYHLASRSQTAVSYQAAPAASVKVIGRRANEPRTPVYVVTGMHSRLAAAELEALREQVSKVADVPCEASDLVLLDEYWPADLPTVRRQPLQLWAVR